MKHHDLEINRLIERLESLGILVEKIEHSGFGSMLNFEMTYQTPVDYNEKRLSKMTASFFIF